MSPALHRLVAGSIPQPSPPELAVPLQLPASDSVAQDRTSIVAAIGGVDLDQTGGCRGTMTTGAAAAAVPVEVEKGSNAASGREVFLKVYEQLKAELLTDNDLVTYTNESRAWVEEVRCCL